MSALDGWYSMRFLSEPITPEEFISAIENVKREDVIRAAGLYSLDTVYKILPKEGEV
jgi:predicted Zn-dependent peptidase